jgi:hypothetical protein
MFMDLSCAKFVQIREKKARFRLTFVDVCGIIETSIGSGGENERFCGKSD